MSNNAQQITVNHPAAVDLSGSVGLVAKYDAGADLATTPTLAGDDLIGVITSGNTEGESCTICVFGKCQAIAGDDLTPGTHRFLTCNGDSQVIPATAGNQVIGEWVGQQSGAAVAGDLVEILVRKWAFSPDVAI